MRVAAPPHVSAAASRVVHSSYLFGRFMRTLSKFALGAALSLAIPSAAFAQRQGAIELGILGRVTKFADTVNLKTAFGLGGNAGIYLFRNLLGEVELSYADVDVDREGLGSPALN